MTGGRETPIASRPVGTERYRRCFRLEAWSNSKIPDWHTSQAHVQWLYTSPVNNLQYFLHVVSSFLLQHAAVCRDIRNIAYRIMPLTLTYVQDARQRAAPRGSGTATQCIASGVNEPLDMPNKSCVCCVCSRVFVRAGYYHFQSTKDRHFGTTESTATLNISLATSEHGMSMQRVTRICRSWFWHPTTRHHTSIQDFVSAADS